MPFTHEILYYKYGQVTKIHEMDGLSSRCTHRIWITTCLPHPLVQLFQLIINSILGKLNNIPFIGHFPL